MGWIIDGGKTDYKILIPEGCGDLVAFAAKELQALLYEATGVSLAVMEDVNQAGDRYFSLGNTAPALANKDFKEFDKKPTQGYFIKTVGEAVFIYSSTDVGVLNGVYGYLEKTLGFDYFTTDIYRIDKTDRVPLNNFDMQVLPDIEYRVASYGYQRLDETAKRRLRLTNYEDIFADTPCGKYHNIFGYISPEEYGETHKEWFNEDKSQLCYTAHGDERLLEEMIETVAEKTFEFLRAGDCSEIIFALRDVETRCDCAACNAEKQKYGADSGALIKFLNRAAEKVEAKLRAAGDCRTDNFHIVFYAYFYLEDAPVTIKKYPNGNIFCDRLGNPVYFYEPEMVLNKHVSPLIAPFWADYHKSFYSPENRKHYETVKKWGVISDNVHLWTYDQYFKNGGFMLPFNSFDSVKDLYVFAKANNVMWFYPEGQVYNPHSTAFVGYRGYLQAKLGWDTSLDVSELKEKFFLNVYGSEGANMLKIFESVKDCCTKLNEKYGLMGWCHNQTLYEEVYWDYKTVTGWLENMRGCEARLADSGETKAAAMVRLEMISPLYILLRLYKNKLPAKLRESYIALMESLLKEFNVGMRCQQMKTDEYLKNLAEGKTV